MPRWQLALSFAAVLAPHSAAAAEVYPSRGITIIVPFPAGGAFDSIGRVIADHMKVSLRQAVIIENVGGKGGSIGVGRVARASPDGYTLSLGILSTHVTNAAAYALPYDPLQDFQPISPLATAPLVIVSKNALPAKDLRGLIDWLKANPDKATLATIERGGLPHIAGLLLQQLTETRFKFVAYRGGAPAMQDLVGGHVDFGILQAGLVLSQASAGKIRAYAVTAKERLASAPGIPAVDEAGVPGLHMSVWSGLWAPKGTPKDAVSKLNSAVRKALADPAVRQRLAEMGQEIFPPDQQTPQALAALQKAEIEKWSPIIKAAGVKAE